MKVGCLGLGVSRNFHFWHNHLLDRVLYDHNLTDEITSCRREMDTHRWSRAVQKHAPRPPSQSLVHLHSAGPPVVATYFDNFAVYFKTFWQPCELLNWTVNEELLRRVSRATLWFPQRFCLCKVSETNVMLPFDLLAVFTVKGNDSVPFSSLFPFFLIKDQIASFQLKEIVVFLN